jgi:cyclohexadienyl dehydratase
MDNMTRDLASPLLGRTARGATLGPGPCERGQKYSGSGRLGNPRGAVKSGDARAARRRAARRLAGIAAVAVVTVLVLPTAAPAETLRVGTSGDYAPFSAGRGAGARGFDLDLARAFAAERGYSLEVVSFRWPALLADLRAGRFDVAMSGITVRPERSAAGRFSVGVAESGAVALVRDSALHPSLDSLDEPEVRIGVNEGGHLERAARARFPRATLLAIPSNAAVGSALAQGLVDAVVSDTLEAPGWLEGAPGAEALDPFTRDRKAYLVRADRPELAAEIDAWLLAREADGTLARLRADHLGQAGPRTAAPLAALVAAIDERLGLMPLVADAKQRLALPLEAPTRERAVEERGVAATRDAARAAGGAAPSEEAVRALFRVLVLAAKDVQRAPRSSAPDDANLDLDADLRPALLRIGDRIAWLSVRLPIGLRVANVKLALHEGLRTPGVSAASVHELATAIAALAAPPLVEPDEAPPASE